MSDHNFVPQGEERGTTVLQPEEQEKFLSLQRECLNAWRRAARSALARSPLNSTQDADDIVHSFITERLPQLVRHITIAPPTNEQAYVRAALRVFAIDEGRRQIRYTRTLHRLRVEQLSDEEVFYEDHVPVSISAEVLGKLPPQRSEAARLFLGVDGRSYSIREIASILNLTRHTVRKLIVEGLLTIAVAMGLSGALSEREVDACRRVLLEGRTPEEAGKVMGLTTTEVRQAMTRARTLVASSFGQSKRREQEEGSNETRTETRR